MLYGVSIYLTIFDKSGMEKINYFKIVRWFKTNSTWWVMILDESCMMINIFKNTFWFHEIFKKLKWVWIFSSFWNWNGSWRNTWCCDLMIRVFHLPAFTIFWKIKKCNFVEFCLKIFFLKFLWKIWWSRTEFVSKVNSF